MSTPDPAAGPVWCASFTHARRHPKVLGRIGGWAPPVQLSFVQLATLAVSLGLLVLSWDLWAPLLPPLLRLLMIVAVPSASCWAVRRSRIEGRSLARTAIGVITLACQPRTGSLAGRPAPSTRVVDWSERRVWIDSGTGTESG